MFVIYWGCQMLTKQIVLVSSQWGSPLEFTLDSYLSILTSLVTSLVFCAVVNSILFRTL